MLNLMAWIGPTFDVLLIALLAAVLWRLGRDPVATWQERETRLQTIFEELRGLVAQSEGLAHDLDAKLAAREERLQALLASASTTGAGVPAAEPRRVRATDPLVTQPTTSDPGAAAREIETLAADGVAVEEIARQVGVAAAEVRLVIGLKAARAARRRAQAGAADAR